MKVHLNLSVEYDVKLELQKLANKYSNGNISKYISELVMIKNTPPSEKVELIAEKPSKKNITENIQIIFEYFNEQVVKNFKPENKLKLLNPERKRCIEKLLASSSIEEIKQAINGFIIARKENMDLKENYLDFRYLLRNFETYLAKGAGVKPKKTKEEADIQAKKKLEEIYAIADAEADRELALMREEWAREAVEKEKEEQLEYDNI